MFSQVSVCLQGISVAMSFLLGWVSLLLGPFWGWVPFPRIYGTWDTTGYSRQADSMHPTGMLSCIIRTFSVHD